MIQFRRIVSTITVIENIAVSRETRSLKRLRRLYGEDYLYDKKGFELVELPQRTERKLLATLR